MSVALCVDFGSTFTKALLVDLEDGTLLGSAAHPTTIGTDVLDGFDACRDRLAEIDPRATGAESFACSSAGGGLRIAVVGNEELITAEAGRRVALNSGGKVVAVIPAATSPGFGPDLAQADPDVVLLLGGTDGGNAEVLLAAAEELARASWQGPVVVAGNADARQQVSRTLGARPHVLADNAVPRIGILEPTSARAAVREMFLAHVIGGKHLSQRADFTEMVRGATPDLVLRGVALIAEQVGDVVVVDVGGATTDVHSVVEIDPEARDVVGATAMSRTVEADLGMRWSAETTLAEGVAAGLVPDAPESRAAAARRLADPDLLDEDGHDHTLAAVAITVALRRHAGRARVVLGPDGRVVERTGKDLREVDLLVGSGGVLRAAGPREALRLLRRATGDGEWQLPRDPAVAIDVDHVLAAAGLLAEEHPAAARGLVSRLARGVA